MLAKAWDALFKAWSIKDGFVDTAALAKADPLDVMAKVADDFIAGKTLENPMLAARASFESFAPHMSAAYFKQEAEIEAIRRAYTNPDGTKKECWLKAPNGEPTKLTERQWACKK